MGLWDQVTRFLALTPEVLEERSILWEANALPLPDQILALRRRQAGTLRPWRVPSIREALGVPAIFGAVNMISNIVGSMSMKAFRGEVEIPPAERPQLIIRPDQFTIPREFYRGSAYNLATRGEAWWYIAKRNSDGKAAALWPVPPQQVMVTEDPRNPLYPIIEWRGQRMPNDDMCQLVYSREPGELRGHGPLQMCGAAISVAVEAQEWAANFYASGGHPSLVIKSAISLGTDEEGNSEAETLRQQWMDRPNNVPRVIDPGIESIEEFGRSEQGAGMLESRARQNVDVATMFGMDATLLNAAMSGSSVTYQNVGSEFEKFLRQCIRPNYLEVIEQTMSDLLTRSIVARFNTDTLTLADIKTRYEVYGLGIDKQIITSEEAREFEGLAAGDVENAEVPQVGPGPRLTIQARSVPEPVRCDGMRMKRDGGVPRLAPCNKLLAESAPFVGTCPRCRKRYEPAA